MCYILKQGILIAIAIKLIEVVLQVYSGGVVVGMEFMKRTHIMCVNINLDAPLKLCVACTGRKL